MERKYVKDKVSIVIPVYGVEKYLERCLVSITNQSYKNLEIILVDDGSKDNSGYICDKWAKIDNRIKVVHQKNMGLASARNTGLKLVSGEFVIAIDSDDFLMINAIEYLHDAIKETDSDVAIFRFNLTYKQKMFKKLPKYTKPLDYYVKENIAIHEEVFFSMDYQTFFWNKLYRSSKIDGIYLKDGLSCYEDIESVPRFLKACNKAVFLNNELLNYMVRINSLSHDSSKVEQRLDILFELCNLNMNRYKEWFPTMGEKFHYRFALEYVLFCHDIFTRLSRSEKRKIMYNVKYVRDYKKNSYDFLSSPFKWYIKVLYLRLKLRLIFIR